MQSVLSPLGCATPTWFLTTTQGQSVWVENFRAEAATRLSAHLKRAGNIVQKIIIITVSLHFLTAPFELMFFVHHGK